MCLPEGRYAIDKSDRLGDITVPSIAEISLCLVEQLNLSFETAIKAMTVTINIITIIYSIVVCSKKRYSPPYLCRKSARPVSVQRATRAPSCSLIAVDLSMSIFNR